jgi:hypothetical protein
MFPQRDQGELQDVALKVFGSEAELTWSGLKGDCKQVSITLPVIEFQLLLLPGERKVRKEFCGILGTAILGGESHKVVAITATRTEAGIIYFTLYVDRGSFDTEPVNRRFLSHHVQEAWQDLMAA